MKHNLKQIESLMVKARLLGTMESISTGCKHDMYFFKDILEGISILYIPDDVEYITEYNDSPSYCNIECKTLIVLGGRNLKDTSNMFRNCQAQSIDLSNLDTSKVTDMDEMFLGCKAQSIDFSNFNTSQVINMSGMFFGCEAQSLDLSSFNTINVGDMQEMFSGCSAQFIDLSSFDTSSIENMYDMFDMCIAEVKTTDHRILDALYSR